MSNNVKIIYLYILYMMMMMMMIGKPFAKITVSRRQLEAMECKHINKQSGDTIEWNDNDDRNGNERYKQLKVNTSHEMKTLRSIIKNTIQSFYIYWNYISVPEAMSLRCRKHKIKTKTKKKQRQRLSDQISTKKREWRTGMKHSVIVTH